MLASPPSSALESSPPTLAIGISFEEKYKRGKVLGRGAIGVAFLVTAQKAPHLTHVAKEIPLGQISEKQKHEALAESELLRTLSHKNVISYIDAILYAGHLYIVMEYADGGDLCQHIHAQREKDVSFSEDVVVTVFYQIASAVCYVHRKHIIHRDLKPANVLVCGKGQELPATAVKLGDFGLGKLFEGTTFQARTTVGTPSYFSPEICRNIPYGRKTDIWSLGCILYELACLYVPFRAKSVPAVALMICTREPEPLPEEYSPELNSLVKSLLQKDPTKRPAAAEILQITYVQQSKPRRAKDAGDDAIQPLASEPSSPELSLLAGAVAPQDLLVHNDKRGKMIRSAFKQLDTTGTGRIPKKSVLQFLHVAAPNIAQESIDDVVMAANGNSGEDIDYETFIDWVLE